MAMCLAAAPRPQLVTRGRARCPRDSGDHDEQTHSGALDYIRHRDGDHGYRAPTGLDWCSAAVAGTGHPVARRAAPVLLARLLYLPSRGRAALNRINSLRGFAGCTRRVPVLVAGRLMKSGSPL